MDRSTALEMARTKRPGDPEGNPEVALRGRSACSLHTSSTFSFLGNDFPSLPPVLKWGSPSWFVFLCDCRYIFQVG